VIYDAAWAVDLGEGEVECRLCPANCKLTEGKAGVCRSRYNSRGRLVTDNYGEAVTLAVDPIEKKPLYHFHPTAKILSTGPNGCNLGCLNCQNWAISQQASKTTYLSPEDLVSAALKQDSIGVAFTYTEPIIWYEYIMDVAPLLRKQGLKVVLVSNGYINQEPLGKLLPMVDAVNIDLKSMHPEFYKRICKGKLQPVLDSIRVFSQSEVHLEITNLVIPGHNDTDDDIMNLVEFVASLDRNIPLHFSAFRPDNKMMTEPTSAETLKRAYNLARKRLNYVFVGNVELAGCSDTICSGCGKLLIRRSWYRTQIGGLDGSCCNACGLETGIVR